MPVYFDAAGKRIDLGSELGRGGEGIVYNLYYSDNVAKIFNTQPDASRVAKLKQMVAMYNETIATYAAWPKSLIFDENGEMCGFEMKRLVGYVPLHMLFSPMDRKRLFPERGYNYLVHVARNLAIAFHKLHENGLVVGDVNEGNILINNNGFVAFIDCDSFQIKDDVSVYYCEVGVPRYTPPELLLLGSFENVLRTPNTDNFSMAILIFQLLFLGRHPFAGRNKTRRDIDEETAIREKEFAYSTTNLKKKLSPPNDSVNIEWLNKEIVDCFHRAFEGDDRPSASDWAKALEGQIANLITCEASKSHTYPESAGTCPWCQFRRSKGIRFFLDDDLIDVKAHFGDIDAFVNGFNPDSIALEKWDAQIDVSSVVPTISRSSLRAELSSMRNKYLLRFAATCIFSLYWFLNKNADHTIGFLLCGVFSVVTLYFYKVTFSQWKAGGKYYVKYSLEKDKFDLLIDEYNHPKDSRLFGETAKELKSKIEQYKALPSRIQELKILAEQQLYQEQLNIYLALFLIDTHNINSIGETRKAAMAQAGILTAADVTQLKTVKVPGMGPKNIQTMFEWQRQLGEGYVYIPDSVHHDKVMERMDEIIKKEQQAIEQEIRKTYQKLNFIKSNIAGKRLIHEREIRACAMNVAQAKANLDFINNMKF